MAQQLDSAQEHTTPGDAKPLQNSGSKHVESHAPLCVATMRPATLTDSPWIHFHNWYWAVQLALR